MALLKCTTRILAFAAVALPCSFPPNDNIWFMDPRATLPRFRVMLDGKPQFIDATGRLIAGPPSPPDPGISHISEGMQVYTTESTSGWRPGRQGYRDAAGHLRIYPQFAHAGPFSEGLAPVALDGNCALFESNGSRWPAPSVPTNILTGCSGLFDDHRTPPCANGFIDKHGAIAIPAKFEGAREFHEGRAAVRKNGRWGFIDHTGRTAIRFLYEDLLDFQNGIAAVKREGAWEFIDPQGNLALPGRFEEARSFSSGRAPVKLQSVWRYLDASGAIAIPVPFLQATPFVLGLAHVQLTKTHWAWIDPTGRPVFEYDWNPLAP